MVNNQSGMLALTAMRVFVGIMFLIASWGKMSAGTGWSQRMLGFLNAQKHMPDWYRSIVDSLIVPHANIFAYLTAYGELFLGLVLIFGILLRPATILGVFMVINFMCAKGISPFIPSNHDTFYLVTLIVIYFTCSQQWTVTKWLEDKKAGQQTSEKH